MLAGYSTSDALRILHSELSTLLHRYEVKGRTTKSIKNQIVNSFLHHNDAYSVFHWTSALLILLSAVLLIVSYASQDVRYRDCWLLVEACILMVLMITNFVFLSWDHRLRREELVSKAKRAVSRIEGCIRGTRWTTSNYIDLNAPLSQCVSLQWTIRDSCVVNLPCSLLVEGDIILLRPGQIAPVKCRRLKTGNDADDNSTRAEYEAGDLYNPAQGLHEPKFFSTIEARQPLKPQPFIVLETGFSENFSMILHGCRRRPVTMLDNERFAAYSLWCERKILPTILLLLLLTNCLRFVFLHSHVGQWYEVLIVLQVQAVVPFLALVFPIVWRFLDAYGNAKIELAFEESVQLKIAEDLKSGSEEFNNDRILAGNVHPKFSWRNVYDRVKIIVCGQSDALPRSANLVQSLGNMTSFCCIDKKGVLSWPNPTAEKVFVLTSKTVRPPASSVSSGTHHTHRFSRTSAAGVASECEAHNGVSQEHCTTHGNDYPTEASFQVLDLTQDTKNQLGLRFDDVTWKSFMTSLKPLGLNILLNTCNLETVDRYTEFADHVTCASLKRDEAVPVVNRRCFCVLANLVGFGSQCTKAFETQSTHGMYRHIPVELSAADRLKSRKSFLKYRMPMPNIFSVIVKDKLTGSKQLFSQGMADLLLDACSDYWDGHDVRPLGDEERKKIADFYHRTSMSSYCTAFAYRPLVENVSDCLANPYLEVPEDLGIFHRLGNSSSLDNSNHHHARRHKLQSKEVRYHGSADSLLFDAGARSIGGSSGTDVDTDENFAVQCNQIFIGMITMQYQAKQDVVDLIESLESACIRFVHFSKENELRSRVFSEKMGLEAGWNCHISLLSENSDVADTATSSAAALNRNPSQGYGSSVELSEAGNKTSKSNNVQQFLIPPPSVVDVSRGAAMGRKQRMRSSSAPNVVVMNANGGGGGIGTCASGDINALTSVSETATPQPQSAVHGGEFCYQTSVESAAVPADDNTEYASTRVPLLHQQHQQQQQAQRVSRRRRSSTRSVSIGEIECLQGNASRNAAGGSVCRSHLESTVPEIDEQIRIVVQQDSGDGKPVTYGHSSEDARSTSSYVMSRKSSYTESIPGLTLSNRARLPKGIKNIRPHIDNVDNVPLLVSLFTDCTPEATQEMLHILQDYGEVTCCIGSVANIVNTGLFLQADCSLCIEPQYPQICVRHSVIDKMPTSRCGSVSPSSGNILGPMDVDAILGSLPCSLSLTAKDDITVIQTLVAIARHHCQRVRNVMLLYIKCQASISLLQLFHSMLLLPPAISPQLVLWLSVVIVPLLSFTLIGNPFNRLITQMAQGKNTGRIVKQTLMAELVYFAIRFVPSLLVCIGCFAANLHSMCRALTMSDAGLSDVGESNYSTTETPLSSSSSFSSSSSPSSFFGADCHLAFGDVHYNETGTWNGWSTAYRGGLVMAQNFLVFQLIVYFILISLCSIHPLDYLWRKSPFDNHLWCVITPTIVAVQVIYFAASVVSSANDVIGHGTVSLGDIPSITWIVAFLWPIAVVGFCELVKRHEIRMWVRHQKRARLDFGTKLGMNSPF